MDINQENIQLLFGDIIFDVIQYDKYQNTCYSDLFDDLRYITYVHYIVRELNKRIKNKYRFTVSDVKLIVVPYGKKWYEQMFNTATPIDPIDHKLIVEIYDLFKDRFELNESDFLH